MFETKVKAVAKLESQVFEGGALGNAERAAAAPPASLPELRLEKIRKAWNYRQSREAKDHPAALVRWYGAERAKTIKYAEVFEICEYGRQPSDQEIRKLFPFFDEPGEAKEDAANEDSAKRKAGV